ncbi:MAG TPA: PEP-utilizing enzyme [Acidimicrobiales bacterium]|jgi:phosphoenolpyruvate-protein kinase (PTS system EI component)
MRDVGRGARVFEAAPVRGQCKVLDGPDEVLDLMTTGADGVLAIVRDAGATFLAPIYHELTGIVCTSGTPRSHIGIVSREFQVPCVMGCVFDGDEPADGDQIELDCTDDEAIVRTL